MADLQDNVILLAFVFVIIIVALNVIGSVMKRGQFHRTVQRALDKGEALTPETLRELGADEDGGRNDNLTGGAVLIAISLALIVMGVLLRFGVLADNERADGIMLAVIGASVIPGFIGVALLVVHALRKRDK